MREKETKKRRKKDREKREKEREKQIDELMRTQEKDRKERKIPFGMVIEL